MDDGQFFLGQRKRNRLLLGGVQGRVEEGRRPCGRGDRVRPALWTLTSTGGSRTSRRHLLCFQKISLEQGQQTADQAKPGLPPASKPGSPGTQPRCQPPLPACSCPSPQSLTLIISLLKSLATHAPG